MSFNLPIETDWMKEQMEHEPTRAYAESVYNIAQKFGFKEALEIGCMWGISTLALLLGSEGRLTSVDLSAYTHAEEEVSLNELKSRWTFLNMNSKDYWQQIASRFDLVYIDGDHHYNYARRDITEGWKRLNPGGILVIDDVLHKNNLAKREHSYGVALVSWQHYYKNPDITDLGFEGKLLWFKKK